MAKFRFCPSSIAAVVIPITSPLASKIGPRQPTPLTGGTLQASGDARGSCDRFRFRWRQGRELERSGWWRMQEGVERRIARCEEVDRVSREENNRRTTA